VSVQRVASPVAVHGVVYLPSGIVEGGAGVGADGAGVGVGAGGVGGLGGGGVGGDGVTPGQLQFVQTTPFTLLHVSVPPM